MLIRSVIIYICALIVIRLMGKRQIGEMQPFEFVITLIIADLACVPMAELSVPLVHGLVPILSLLVVHFLICVLSRKFMFARYLLTGKPAIVITPKGIDYKELKSLNMTLDDLMELVRGCNVYSLSQISYAILETNGKMCVISKAESEPPTREDLKVKVSQNSLPMNIILDGQLMQENVEIAELKSSLLNECLDKAGIKKIQDVLIMTIDTNGEVFIQGKYAKECFTFQVDYDGGGKW